MKRNLYIFALILIFNLLLIGTLKTIFAQQCTDYNPDTIRNASKDQLLNIQSICQQASSKASNDIYSYKAQIDSIEIKRNSTLIQIKQTEMKIEEIQKEVDILTSRIDGLDTSLDYLSKLMVQRIADGYKNRNISLLSLLFDSNNAGELFDRIKYLKTAQDNNQKLLVQVQETKLNFEEQKKLREEKKAELDSLQKYLAQLNTDLQNQQNALNALLAKKESEKATIDSILAQAQAQLSAFSSFVSSSGLGPISADTSWPSDYFSQRDNRWASKLVNNSPLDCGYNGYKPCNIINVGCLVTSVAMVAKHYGQNVTPADIASNSDRFYGNTAYMNLPWESIAGRSYCGPNAAPCWGNVNIDQELQNGNYVIVGIGNCNNGGSHFVVLTKKDGKDYIMSDPINGPNLKFYSYYSNICSAATFK